MKVVPLPRVWQRFSKLAGQKVFGKGKNVRGEDVYLHGELDKCHLTGIFRVTNEETSIRDITRVVRDVDVFRYLEQFPEIPISAISEAIDFKLTGIKIRIDRPGCFSELDGAVAPSWLSPTMWTFERTTWGVPYSRCTQESITVLKKDINDVPLLGTILL